MYIPRLVTVLHAISFWHLCNASPVTNQPSHAIKEHHAIPRDWIKLGSAPATEIISLQIGLRQSNEGSIEEHLLQVSDPTHARYGQHLSSEQVNQIIKPADETVRLVQEWLHQNGITEFELNSALDWIYVPAISIQDAERLLQTKYAIYQHKWDGDLITRTPEWSLPIHLHEHIDVIQPTTSFFRPSRRVTLDKRSRDFVLKDSREYSMSWWEKTGKALYGVSFERIFLQTRVLC